MFSLRKKEPVTLRRTVILTLLPILFKLTVWALIRKAARNSLDKNELVIKAKKMRTEGYSEAEVAEALGINTTMLRSLFFKYSQEDRDDAIGLAKWMKDQGDSNAMIAERLGVPENHIRTLLRP